MIQAARLIHRKIKTIVETLKHPLRKVQMTRYFLYRLKIGFCKSVYFQNSNEMSYGKLRLKELIIETFKDLV